MCDMGDHIPGNMVFEVEEYGGADFEVEDHDSMEVHDHAPENTFKDDATNTLIHDTFGCDSNNDDDIDVIHDISLLEMPNMTLYKGSQTTLLFIVLLLVNLKVMNDLSNITMSRMLRLYIYIYISLFLIKGETFTINIVYINSF
jgi:hypothetical protein